MYISIAVADPGFPVGGGANLRRVNFLAKTYVKTKEIDPVGGGAPAATPLDPPMNSIDAEMSQNLVRVTRNSGRINGAIPVHVNAIQNDDNEFSIKIKCVCSDLFTGIGNMNTVIDFKLKDDAVPDVASICRVTHALQEPLRLELGKIVDEGILRKFFKILEPWSDRKCIITHCIWYHVWEMLLFEGTNGCLPEL